MTSTTTTNNNNNNSTTYVSQKFNYSFKIIMVGDSFVGKTSLLNRFADDFYSKEFIATIGK